jgi:hypothetical protein
LVHVKSEEGELEVSLIPAVYEEEKKTNESPTFHKRTGSFDAPQLTLSSSSLEKKMDQIILEAKLEAVKLSGVAPPSPNNDARSSDLIQQALDRAAARSRVAAAQAVSAGAGITQSDPGVGSKVEVPKLRTTGANKDSISGVTWCSDQSISRHEQPKNSWMFKSI